MIKTNSRLKNYNMEVCLLIWSVGIQENKDGESKGYCENGTPFLLFRRSAMSILNTICFTGR